MKIGFRRPSLKKRIAARTSWKRIVRHRLGLKAPRGWGWITNPRKAAYNRVYNRTSFDIFKTFGRKRRQSTSSKSTGGGCCGCLAFIIIGGVVTATLAPLFHGTSNETGTESSPSVIATPAQDKMRDADAAKNSATNVANADTNPAPAVADVKNDDLVDWDLDKSQAESPPKRRERR